MGRGRGSDRTAMDRGCSAESPLVCSAFFLRFFLCGPLNWGAPRNHFGSPRLSCCAPVCASRCMRPAAARPRSSAAKAP
eukprot:scaffold2735_cov114-Isochrysis_galbana.AAC.8